MKKEIVKRATAYEIKDNDKSSSEKIINSLVYSDEDRASDKARFERFGSYSASFGSEGVTTAYKEWEEGDLSAEEKSKYAEMIGKRAERVMKRTKNAYLYTKGLTEPQRANAARGYLDAEIVLDKVHEFRSSKKDLTSRVSSVIAISGLIGGLFFLSSNITGNAIGSMTNPASNMLGAGLMIAGLVGAFFWVNKRK